MIHAETQQQPPPKKPIRAFDSLAFAKRLEAGGFTRQQAEVLAEEQAALIDERLSTKDDITTIRADIAVVRTDIEALRISAKADLESLHLLTKAELQGGLAQIKAEIVKWVLGTFGLQTVALLAALFGLLKTVHN